MKHTNPCLTVAALLLGVTAQVAHAQDADDAATVPASEDSKTWSVTITPRVQRVFFQPNGSDDVFSMGTYGASVTLRNADNRFGFTGTFLSGNGSGDYDFTGGSTAAGGGPNNYAYKLKRREFSGQFEYTPRETGVTLIIGYHRFDVENPEFLTNPLPGNSEVNFYRTTVTAPEIGLRLASRLGANSRHAVSTQLMVGVGRGRLTIDENEIFRPFNNSRNIKGKGTGYLADFAIGYNYFLSRHVSLGARARGYVIYVDHPEAEPIFALAPELNLSFRF